MRSALRITVCSPQRPWISALLLTLLALLLGVVRWLSPERSLDAVGPRALLDAGFALGLWAFVLLLAAVVGRHILRRLRLRELTTAERLVFGLPLGLAVLAYGVLLLGLAGLLRPWAIVLWLALVAVAGWRDWVDMLGRLAIHLRALPRQWRRLALGPKIIAAVAGIVLALTLVQALAPPWDYDGLMYHLTGPRAFLQAGRILFMPDLWQANGPFTVEMLFTIGLAFGCDTFARLVHLTYGILLIIGTYALARRLLGRLEGWLALTVLLGVPIFPLWASIAYIDIAWALYELLAIYAVLLWARRGGRRWLVVAGMAAGLAMACKYLGLGGAAVAGVWLLWLSRRAGWRALLLNALTFGAAALFVASPWYLKNWLWADNPVYPMYFGGKGWSAEQTEMLMTYLNSFGAGHTWRDILLLPWNLYIRHERFVTLLGSLEYPSPLFVLAPFYWLTRKRRALHGVAGVAALRCGIWALGSHQTRFLLPVFPILSVLAAAVLASATRVVALRRWGLVLAGGLAGGLLAATLASSFIFMGSRWPLPCVLGFESKADFLTRAVDGYASLRYVERNLPATARVLTLWHGCGYYGDARIVPDQEPSLWAQLRRATDQPAVAAARLRQLGITHLRFSTGDAGFWLQHDPAGDHFRAADFLLNQFVGACARRVYEDTRATLYEITQCR
jgi:hypothetical protein